MPCSCGCSVQYLCDVDELHWDTDTFRAAPLMHQARTVRGNHVLRASLGMIADLVVTHLGRNDFFEHTECAAEAATFVGTSRLDELNPLNLGEQVDRLGEERF